LRTLDIWLPADTTSHAWTARSGVVDPEVIGRTAELSVIDNFLGGNGAQVLVIDGPAGIGKTTLWQAAVKRATASGYDVLRAQPVEVEARLSLGGLADLLRGAPVRARERLPELQRIALAAVADEDGAVSAAVDSRLLGAAVLGLLRTLSEEAPVLIAVDDLQWLDEASGAVVIYALRRLELSNVRVVVSCRRRFGDPLPFGLEHAFPRTLERLDVGPMSEGAISQLLRHRLGLELSRASRHALYDASLGNPFYALELGHANADVAAGDAIRIPRDVRELVDARLRRLPPGARDALLFVAALADPREEILDRVGVRTRLGDAIVAGMLEVDRGRLRFVHPLVGAAAWDAAGAERRREVHRRLAACFDDPEQHALHLEAAGDYRRDEIDLAERAAELARRRGAPASAAELFDIALRHAEADDDWARLAEGAAETHAEAGHWDRVQELIDQAQQRLPAGVERARVLVTAAELSPGLADLFVQTIREAGSAASLGVRARIGLSMQRALSGHWSDAVRQAQDAVDSARTLGARSLLGLALSNLGGLHLLDSRPDAETLIAEAEQIEQEVGGLPTSVFESPRMWRATHLLFRDDPSSARRILEEARTVAIERGDEMSAFQFTHLLVFADIRAGDLAAARAETGAGREQVALLNYEYGRHVLGTALATLEAWSGNLDRARMVGARALEGLTELRDGLWSTYALGALLLTELCDGDADAALVHADALDSRFDAGREPIWTFHQGDAIEALVLAGEHEAAFTRAARLRDAGTSLGLPRFLALADRGEALAHEADGDLAAAHTSIERARSYSETFPIPLEHARTLMAYGRILRRRRRRHEARAALGEALSSFERVGARHFAKRAEEELRHVSGRAPAPPHQLTPAEARVARLVADGLSNQQVASELVVAVSTVEATLTRVYRKLGLRSRSQLAARLDEHQPDR
jgi:DNA-binding CsgD family transcriptional regulator/tetratricopeptide (TPR) repeat protein